ncbi:hypothetical protein B0H19DRAFT_616160 [Mycena capillaripes]|nr:hypothetical protein B0H19DRAFT_616160 [Mycena capillaripes]
MPLRAHTTLLIAVVAGSVGGILLLLLLFRLFRRPAEQVPLPPKQELARYREQQANQVVVESRPPTWYDSGFLSAPSGTFAGSNSSLLPPDSRGGSPFRRPSLNTSESPSEDISYFSGTVPMAPALQLPHFDTSSSSLSTAETDSWSPLSPPSATRPSHPPHGSLVLPLPLRGPTVARGPCQSGPTAEVPPFPDTVATVSGACLTAPTARSRLFCRPPSPLMTACPFTKTLHASASWTNGPQRPCAPKATRYPDLSAGHLAALSRGDPRRSRVLRNHR